ncbi:MAG TPA: HAD-IA family hydrolase [Syntrophorhabdaceae bacterium]|nr:HAD-IA family hydrolase [Syntrophorhabdaceae bacterium]HQM80575.1 HAD-IA family hydrolase [Syntrophorhabdaceae bacterium]
MGWKNIILDFDGTLIDSQHLFLACANELSEVFGYEPIDQISRLREKSTPSVLTDVLGLLPEQIPLWMQKLKDRLSNNIRSAVTVKGMKEALFALRDDYRLGILTSNSEETVRHILVRDGIGQVDFIWADAYVLEKDRAIEGAVAKYALSREETVYVGDEVGDVDACRKVGIKIIAVSWGFNSKKILERKEPDYLVETPMQLRSILKTYDI